MPSPLNAGLGLFDPAAASDVLARGLAARRPARPRVSQGYAIDWAFQCWTRDGCRATFAAGDTLASLIEQNNVATPIVTPSAAFFTNGSTQSGCDQGQVLVGLTDAQAAQLWPTGGGLQYTLVVTLAPAAAPSKTIEIVRLPLVVVNS